MERALKGILSLQKLVLEYFSRSQPRPRYSQCEARALEISICQ